MALPVPNLDDRNFQDLVNEARSRIPQYCPEWTDHNLSDPGITLIELFAWMTELIIYRLNRVPDKNYVKFLELIGVRLTPGNPATTDLTFRLTAPLSGPVTIESGTEVATVRTETQDAIVFTTDSDLRITPPRIEYLLTSADNQQYSERLVALRGNSLNDSERHSSEQSSQPVRLFDDIPQPGNAFYLGFGEDIRSLVLVVEFGLGDLASVGVNPDNPPLVWEYWDSEELDWISFDRQPESIAWLELDTTHGLNARGTIQLHVPGSAGITNVAMREAYWLRCRVTPFTREQGSYESSPQLNSIGAFAIGGTVSASNLTRQMGEIIGTSDGKSGQSMNLSRGPMLQLQEGETVEVESPDNLGWEDWQQVTDFSQSNPSDRHYICDPVAGQIQFGPAIRSPKGELVRYGAVPPRGSRVRLSSYRYGSGPQGNVGRNTLNVLKTSIPYIGSVTNRRAARGGVYPEEIESAKMRGPQALRTLQRAVTAEDFEYLAREASPAVGRARCLQPQEDTGNGTPPPGVVNVLLVPSISGTGRQLAPEDLALSPELVDQVKDYLDERRLLSVMLTVSEPDYTWISVEAQVNAREGMEFQVQASVEEALYRFINPISGGNSGEGWPFGRSLFDSELLAKIQSVPGVNYTEELKVFTVDPVSGRRTETGRSLTLAPSGLVCSHRHIISCSG